MMNPIILIIILFYFAIPIGIVLFDVKKEIVDIKTIYEFILNLFLWPIPVIRWIVEKLS